MDTFSSSSQRDLLFYRNSDNLFLFSFLRKRTFVLFQSHPLFSKFGNCAALLELAPLIDPLVFRDIYDKISQIELLKKKESDVEPAEYYSDSVEDAIRFAKDFILEDADDDSSFELDEEPMHLFTKDQIEALGDDFPLVDNNHQQKSTMEQILDYKLQVGLFFKLIQHHVNSRDLNGATIELNCFL